MCQKLQLNWELLACTSFTKLYSGHKLCEFCEEDWLGQWGTNLAQHDGMDRRDGTKCLGSNGQTEITLPLHFSILPWKINEFLQGKTHLGHEIFLGIEARYDVKIMRE